MDFGDADTHEAILNPVRLSSARVRLLCGIKPRDGKTEHPTRPDSCRKPSWHDQEEGGHPPPPPG